MSSPNWYQITRTLQQLDPDEQRSKVESIPAELDGCTLLLIKTPDSWLASTRDWWTVTMNRFCPMGSTVPLTRSFRSAPG